MSIIRAPVVVDTQSISAGPLVDHYPDEFTYKQMRVRRTSISLAQRIIPSTVIRLQPPASMYHEYTFSLLKFPRSSASSLDDEPSVPSGSSQMPVTFPGPELEQPYGDFDRTMMPGFSSRAGPSMSYATVS